MKISKLLLASAFAVTLTLVGCKKETTSINSPEITNASYDITLDNAKYIWNGNSNGVSLDSNYTSVLFQDSLTKKYFLVFEYTKESTDTTFFGFACPMNSIANNVYTKKSLDTLLAFRNEKNINFIYSQDNINLTFSKSYPTTPAIGSIISGNIAGTLRGSDFSKIIFGDTTTFVHNYKASFNAVYKGIINKEKLNN